MGDWPVFDLPMETPKFPMLIKPADQPPPPADAVAFTPPLLLIPNEGMHGVAVSTVWPIMNGRAHGGLGANRLCISYKC